MHIHVLGVCGTFMGGIAVIAKQAGHRVTGCDTNVYPPMSTQLQDQGIELIQGYTADQLSLSPDLWVVGNVVSRGNPLMEAILDGGDPFTSGPQWLAENILKRKWVLAVSGTHGKTTTSSMLAWILECAALEPGFLIGGVPQNYGISARATESMFFVIEADEYDTAFFDKRSKFIHYRPKTAILNNIEFDHADIFADLGSIERQFHHFVRTIPRTGRILANGREKSVERVLAQGCWTPVERFGVEHGWRAIETMTGTFSVLHDGAEKGAVRWELLGEHNRLNALAAIAAARHAGVSPEQAIESLSSFRNVRRRLEISGTAGGVTVYDDFAHHPTAIATTIAGLREKVGRARVLAVLELRSNTMKLGLMKEDLPASLAGANLVFCYTNALEWDAPGALAPLGPRLACEEDLGALVAAIALQARPGDHILVMSNGGFGGIHQRLLNALAPKGL
jgi:UDP-N-acetylmuramate: L-alanyl-gamma-D-glutamyl-meso-diaminopimelate ligase